MRHLIQTILVLLFAAFGSLAAIAATGDWARVSYPAVMQELSAQPVNLTSTARAPPTIGANLTSTGTALAQTSYLRALDGAKATGVTYALLRSPIAPNGAPKGGARFITRADGQTLDTNSITIPGPTNSPYGKMDYLLGKVPGNQDSIGKGGYFGGTLGFKSGDDLARAMQIHLKDNFGSAVIKGSKVEVTAPITGPNGVTANVKAAWQVKPDGSVSFVTAFPGPKQ